MSASGVCALRRVEIRQLYKGCAIRPYYTHIHPSRIYGANNNVVSRLAPRKKMFCQPQLQYSAMPTFLQFSSWATPASRHPLADSPSADFYIYSYRVGA